MNQRPTFRALVVDDEPMVRMATMRALARENFSCDAAHNGREALELVRQTRYELVVTDLRMPESNGHALAAELLARADRPAVAVLTGVIEPKLAHDLALRGVDEVLFKPVDYSLMAAKMRGLVERRAADRSTRQSLPSTVDATAGREETVSASDVTCGPAAESSAKLKPSRSQIESSAPAPPDQNDACSAIPSNRLDSDTFAAAVQLDPRMVMDMLRLADGIARGAEDRIQQLELSLESVRRSRQNPHFLWPLSLFAAGLLCGWALFR